MVKMLLTDIQNRASQLIQEDTVTGTLCFQFIRWIIFPVVRIHIIGAVVMRLMVNIAPGNLSYMVDKVQLFVI